MPTSSTCLHNIFCKMLPSIYIGLLLSLPSSLSPCPLPSIPHLSLILSLFSSLSLLTRFNNISNGVTSLSDFPHCFINFSLSHIRCFTLRLNNSILTMINPKSGEIGRREREVFLNIVLLLGKQFMLLF